MHTEKNFKTNALPRIPCIFIAILDGILCYRIDSGYEQRMAHFSRKEYLKIQGIKNILNKQLEFLRNTGVFCPLEDENFPKLAESTLTSMLNRVGK